MIWQPSSRPPWHVLWLFIIALVSLPMSGYQQYSHAVVQLGIGAEGTVSVALTSPSGQQFSQALGPQDISMGGELPLATDGAAKRISIAGGQLLLPSIKVVQLAVRPPTWRLARQRQAANLVAEPARQLLVRQSLWQLEGG